MYRLGCWEWDSFLADCRCRATIMYIERSNIQEKLPLDHEEYLTKAVLSSLSLVIGLVIVIICQNEALNKTIIQSWADKWFRKYCTSRFLFYKELLLFIRSNLQPCVILVLLLQWSTYFPMYHSCKTDWSTGVGKGSNDISIIIVAIFCFSENNYFRVLHCPYLIAPGWYIITIRSIL